MIFVINNDVTGTTETIGKNLYLSNTLGLEYIPGDILIKLIYWMDYHKTTEVTDDIKDYVDKIENARGRIKFRRKLSGRVLAEVLNRDILTDKTIFREDYIELDMTDCYTENPLYTKEECVKYLFNRLTDLVDWKRMKLNCQWFSTKDNKYHNIFTKGMRLQRVDFFDDEMQFIYDLSFGKPKGLSEFIRNKRKNNVQYPDFTKVINRVELYTIEGKGINNKSIMVDDTIDVDYTTLKDSIMVFKSNY